MVNTKPNCLSVLKSSLKSRSCCDNDFDTTKTSSKYTNTPFNLLVTLYMSLWKVWTVFFRPKGIRVNLKRPNGVEIAVFGTSFCSNWDLMVSLNQVNFRKNCTARQTRSKVVNMCGMGSHGIIGPTVRSLRRPVSFSHGRSRSVLLGDHMEPGFLHLRMGPSTDAGCRHHRRSIALPTCSFSGIKRTWEVFWSPGPFVFMNHLHPMTRRGVAKEASKTAGNSSRILSWMCEAAIYDVYHAEISLFAEENCLQTPEWMSRLQVPNRWPSWTLAKSPIANMSAASMTCAIKNMKE